MPSELSRTRALEETRTRILDVSLEVLGRSPDAGMGEIASAAGVVRRTVYGHFPTRTDLVRTLTQRAVDEIAGVLDEAGAAETSADRVWVDFIRRLWPLMNRYHVLLALRRGEHGAEIHAVLKPVDQTLADLVQRGQDDEAFGRHLPAPILGQVAFSAVFVIADNTLAGASVDVTAALLTSLLLLGVPEARAQTLISPHQPAGQRSGLTEAAGA